MGIAGTLSHSAQPDDLAVLVEVDAHGGGLAAEAGHGAHVAADGVDEPGPDGGPHLSHRQSL